MKHHASPNFWRLYQSLPIEVRHLADKNFALLKQNHRHPSLHFKQIEELWSVRIGDRYRALAVDVEDGMQWFWIGSHADYDKLIERI